MSYVRQGHCDLYVYEDIDFGLTCCNCPLKAGGSEYPGTPGRMLDHLKRHAAAGHDTGGCEKMIFDELDCDELVTWDLQSLALGAPPASPDLIREHFDHPA